MDDQRDVGSPLATGTPVEGWMLREDVVREVLARLARGEHIKTVARELGVDKKQSPQAPVVCAPRTPMVFSTRRGEHVCLSKSTLSSTTT